MTTKIREHHLEKKTVGLADLERLVAAATKAEAVVADSALPVRAAGGRRRAAVEEPVLLGGGYRLVLACHVEQGKSNQ